MHEFSLLAQLIHFSKWILKICTGGGDDTDEVFAALVDIEKTTDYGPELTQNVAAGISKTVSRPLSKETLTKLSSKLLVPANCKMAAVPKMNSEIWSNLPGKARIQDLQLQNLQQTNSQGLVALALIANQIALHRHELPENLAKEVLQVCMDGANVLGNGLQMINMKRRQEVKQYLNQEFAGICNTSVPVTENLFGDDLKETMKASKTTSQVMRSGFTKARGFRPQPYNRGIRQNYPQPSSSFSGASGSLNRQRPSFNNQRRGGWKSQRHPSQFQPWKNNQRFPQ